MFSVELVRFVRIWPKEIVYRIMADQLLRSGTSIGANVIEAQAASSKRDFIKFYQIALKSANETKYWLAVLLKATNLDSDLIKRLLGEVEELAKMLGASLLTMKNKR